MVTILPYPTSRWPAPVPVAVRNDSRPAFFGKARCAGETAVGASGFLLRNVRTAFAAFRPPGRNEDRQDGPRDGLREAEEAAQGQEDRRAEGDHEGAGESFDCDAGEGGGEGQPLDGVARSAAHML